MPQSWTILKLYFLLVLSREKLIIYRIRKSTQTNVTTKKAATKRLHLHNIKQHQQHKKKTLAWHVQCNTTTKQPSVQLQLNTFKWFFMVGAWVYFTLYFLYSIPSADALHHYHRRVVSNDDQQNPVISFFHIPPRTPPHSIKRMICILTGCVRFGALF